MRQLAYGYDVLGHGTLFLSKDAAGHVVNKVERSFDGYGNLKIEIQDQDGDGVRNTAGTVLSNVSGDTITYGYDYDDGKSRLVSLDYGDGFAVYYSYAADTIDDHISRVNSLDAMFAPSDDLHSMEAYTYIGLNRLDTALRGADKNWGLTVGYDTFNRVGRMNWSTGAGVKIDDQLYDYDANGNIKGRQYGTVDGNRWWEITTYNGLNQATSYESPFYATGHLGNSVLRWSQDSLGNRIDTNNAEDTQKYGDPVLVDRRISNGKGSIKETLLLPETDGSGYPTSITSDAWGRAVKIFSVLPGFPQSPIINVLRYDALNRMTKKDLYTGKEDLGNQTHQQDIYAYSGDLELRNYRQLNNAALSIFSNNIWSPDGRMVGRVDASQFIWTVTDVQQRTTALIQNGTLNILERFVYDIDGMIKGTTADFTLINNPISTNNWTQFVAGKQWINVWDLVGTRAFGFYQSSRDGLFDPQNNSLIIANPAYTNQWQPPADGYGLEGTFLYDYLPKILNVVGNTLLGIATGGASLSWSYAGYVVAAQAAGAGIAYGSAWALGAKDPGQWAWLGAELGAGFPGLGRGIVQAGRLAVTATNRVIPMARAAVGRGLQYAGEYADAFIQGWKLAPRGGTYLGSLGGGLQDVLERFAFATQHAMGGLVDNVNNLLTRFGRFFYDPRAFRAISVEYWQGAANGRSLHHWLIPQRWTWVPQGIRNAEFNLIALPSLRGIFHPTLSLNTWMGFATRWGGMHAVKAGAIEWGIRAAIPGSIGGGAYIGWEVGEYLSGEGK